MKISQSLGFIIEETFKVCIKNLTLQGCNVDRMKNADFLQQNLNFERISMLDEISITIFTLTH